MTLLLWAAPAFASPQPEHIAALSAGLFSESPRKHRSAARTKYTRATIRKLKIKNSGNRSGHYFLPENYASKETPVLLLLHGSSIQGLKVLRLFKKIAARRGFVIVAPDSVNEWGWSIADNYSHPTEDQTHILDALHEVLSLKDINPAANKILVAGISAGGAVASVLGTNDTRFSNFAVLHGGVRLNSLGQLKPSVWLSTGTIDPFRTPSELQTYRAELELSGFSAVEYREYDVAHEVPLAERKELIRWWIRGLHKERSARK